MIVKINGVQVAGAAVDNVNNPVDIVGYFKKASNDLTFYASGVGLLPLISAYMGLSKYLAVGVIMFAGTAWMFGHRTQAIQLLIGAAAGFLIILNAWDMVNFLEVLKGKG